MVIDEKAAYEFLTTVEGPRCAAWLVWEHKQQLHEFGYVRFKIIQGNPLPKWFSFAMRCLETRPRWIVDYQESNCYRMWSVYWKASRAYVRAHAN